MVFEGDPLAFYGKLIIEEHNDSILRDLHRSNPQSQITDLFNLSEWRGHTSTLDKLQELGLYHNSLGLSVSDKDNRDVVLRPVGILGAGIGGLYAALILDSIGIKYEILEASDRIGGRISTYKFPKGGRYDYHEEGAMRFPFPQKENGKYKNGIMKRLAELVEYGPLNTGSDPLRKKLIPYYYSARDRAHPGFYYFNGVHQRVEDDVAKGSFRAEDMGVGTPYIKAGSDAIHGDVIDRFVNILVNDLETGSTDGWELMKENDVYSVRGYMASKYLPSRSLNLPSEHLPGDVINWCSLLQSGFNQYDRAFTEAVLSELAFASVGNTDYGNVNWKCFEGGSETLPKKIEEYLKTKGVFVEFKKRVTSIGKDIIVFTVSRPYAKEVVIEENEIGVTIKISCLAVKVNRSETNYYEHVISTLPVPVLRTIDLRSAGLNVMQKNALRSLVYGPSIKIAMLFKSDWWYQKLGIVGGQSYTDLPIRNVIYPSHGVDSNDPKVRCKVLTVSYTWTSDASRLGALALDDEELLKDLVLRNLAEAHYGVNDNKDITYDFLAGEFEAMHVKDWNTDGCTMGAYAYFLPGEFGRLYSSLNFPAADGQLHFAGEALSTRHSWVVGALDSAWRAVYEYLKITKQDGKLEEFKGIWGENIEWTARGKRLEDGCTHDLLDEHVQLTRRAILSGFRV